MTDWEPAEVIEDCDDDSGISPLVDMADDGRGIVAWRNDGSMVNLWSNRHERYPSAGQAQSAQCIPGWRSG